MSRCIGAFNKWRDGLFNDPRYLGSDIAKIAWETQQEKIDSLQSQLQTKDALIKELIEGLEFINNTAPPMYKYNKVEWEIIKKARTLLDSEAVKAWRGER